MLSLGDGKEQHLEFLERVVWAKGMAYAKILWCLPDEYKEQ